MKRSMFLATLLVLVLAAPALSSDAFLSGPAFFGVVNSCLNLMGVGFDGNEAVDGVVGYGAGNGPRGVFRGDRDGITDGVVDYGVGSGPRRPNDDVTDGVVGYGTGTGPRCPQGG